jgi:hypothetical protein
MPITEDLSDLLGGAERVRTRERGFTPWSPRQDKLNMLEQVRAILVEYEANLPLTVRQIYYRLIGRYGYPKTDELSAQLGEMLNRARRAEMIPMDAIRDDGGSIRIPNFWHSASDFLNTVRRQAECIELDRTEGQEKRLILACESAGMVPQLARVANPYGVPVISSGGFESTTERHRFAKQVVDHLIEPGRPTALLHVGDHDPWGLHLYVSFAEDVDAFAQVLFERQGETWRGDEVEFTRLAVTPEQCEDYELTKDDYVPPKNAPAYGFDWTCQAEALAPDVLAAIVREAVEDQVDDDAYQRVLRREARARSKLRKVLGGSR